MASPKRSRYKKTNTSGWNAIAESRIGYPARSSQLSLFDFRVKGDSNGKATFRDPAFGDNKNLPVHRWVPWIAGYSTSFVDDVISMYLTDRKKVRILDPFSGVGTTLLQSALRGHDAIGFEINPYPALAARAKLSALDLNLVEFDSAVNRLRKKSSGWKTCLPADTPAVPLKSKIPFFSPKVLQQVRHAISFINAIKSPLLADIFGSAFGAVMVSFSNYSYEPSLGSRPAAGKPLVHDADVDQVLLGKLLQMQTDMYWLQNEMRGKLVGKSEVINADFFSANSAVAPESVDLMITSPPYMNNYHYVRNTRPQLYWLNFISSPKEQKHLETNNFGQYWQTVRDAAPVKLSFEHESLQKTLKKLRETRLDDGPYGGPGWANYVASYFNDSYRFMDALKRLLSPGGVGVVVIGNSIIQGIDIRTESLLGEIGELHGLVLEGMHCIREKRVGASITNSSVRHGGENKAVLSESAVVLRKHRLAHA